VGKDLVFAGWFLACATFSGADFSFEVGVELDEGVVERGSSFFDASEDIGSFECTDDAVSDSGGVNIRTHRAGSATFFDCSDEHLAPVLQRCTNTFAQHRIAVVCVNSGVQHGTTAGEVGVLCEVGDVVLQAIDFVGYVFHAAAAGGGDGTPGVVEGFGGEFFFAFEVAIDAAFVEAGGFHNVRERAADVAALVEDGSGALDDELPGLLAFAHTVGWMRLQPNGLRLGCATLVCKTKGVAEATPFCVAEGFELRLGGGFALGLCRG